MKELLFYLKENEIDSKNCDESNSDLFRKSKSQSHDFDFSSFSEKVKVMT